MLRLLFARSREAERCTAVSSLLCVGEAMVQVTPTEGRGITSSTRFQLAAGGAESNVASLVAQLGHHTTWLGAVGQDPFGEIVVSSMETVGVDVSRVLRDPDHRTGVYFKEVDGERTAVYYYRQSSAASYLGPTALQSVSHTRWDAVHLSGITPALSESCDQLARSVIVDRVLGSATVSFDVNYRKALWPQAVAAKSLMELANFADVVFVGMDEARDLWGLKDARAVRDFLPDPRLIVIKNADVEAIEFDGDEETRVQALPVEVVESVGAGDAFAAGWLSAHLESRSSSDRLRLGHMMAAQALLTTTDAVVLPPGTTVSALLAQSHNRGST